MATAVADPSNEKPPVMESTVYMPWGEEKVTYLGPVALIRSKSYPEGYHVVTFPHFVEGNKSITQASCTCRYYQIHGDCKRHIEAAMTGRAIARNMFEEAFPNGLI